MDHQKHSNNVNANFLMSSSSSSSTALTSSPTTFVQADTRTFRELVQKLTGADDNLQDKLPITLPSRYSSSSSRSSSTASQNDHQLGGVLIGGPRRSAFKLQERRQNMRKLEIKLGLTSIRNSPNSPTAYSPREMQTYLVGSSPVPSPVTPLGSDTVFSSRFPGSGSSSPASVVEDQEEKAIAEKGFYLHPSPLSTPRGLLELPELLPLFPLESPKQKQQSRDL
ncbi:Vq motif-containing protein [Thalictrum thalictroides]|uniref:Vq motif-containing protein n=1 Tax=Thalictrum thalictroides TaxID=46969 RepID=A0A7J6WZK6_THATH|nr:Vq motif-containing protein [Thalictrum thalictroides]